MDKEISLEDMVFLLRTQKHDILNYLQVVQGFLQLNKTDLARHYLTDAIKEIQHKSNVLKIQSPSLVGLICIYREKLENRGATVEIIIEELSWEQSQWDDQLAKKLGWLGDTLLAATDLMKCNVELVLSLVEGKKLCVVTIANWPQEIIIPEKLMVTEDNNLVVKIVES